MEKMKRSSNGAGSDIDINEAEQAMIKRRRELLRGNLSNLPYSCSHKLHVSTYAFVFSSYTDCCFR